MRLTVERGQLLVEKTDGDPRFKNGFPDARGYYGVLAESTFLYHVKKVLLAHGLDCIKKRVWRDGGLVDETQQWVRTRAWAYGGEDSTGQFAVYNGRYQIEDAGEVFNRESRVYLDILGDVGALSEALEGGDLT